LGSGVGAIRWITSFETIVLLGFVIITMIYSIVCFIHGDWALGIFLALVSCMTAVIGQGLHKDKTARDLAQGKHLRESEYPDTYDKLTPEISKMLVGAMTKVTGLFVLTVIVISWRKATPWSIIFLRGIVAAIVFPLVSSFLVFVAESLPRLKKH